MNYDELVPFIQGHFTDGLVLVIGSGLSAAEGIPGMPELASHLCSQAGTLKGDDERLWSRIEGELKTGAGLEGALLKYAPSETLEEWIVERTCEFLTPKERDVVGKAISGAKRLRLTTFLDKYLKPAAGIPILTPNYDRLIEVACELAGFHVDTTAIGHYAGAFDHERSCMGSARSIGRRASTPVITHFPRAIVLKPHGSFDWYRTNGVPRRCSLEIEGARLIITPGHSKYRAGYEAPFDKHRDLANDHIKKAARLLVVGYGFNDDHLQTHLEQRIRSGTPSLILNLNSNPKTDALCSSSPRCISLTKSTVSKGITVTTHGGTFHHPGPDLWDLGVLTEELLS